MTDLIHGTNRSDLRAWCLRQVTSQQRQWPGQRAIMLVPEQGKMEMERDFLAQAQAAPLMLAEVLSFRRFAWRLLGEIGVQTEKTVDTVGQAILIQKILRRHKEKLTVFGPLAEKPGFVREVASVLGDFKRHRVSAKLLMSAAETCQDEALAHKTQDFACILASYEQVLSESRLADSDDDLERLANLLQKIADQPQLLEHWPHQRLRWLQDTSFWVNGFGELRAFTPQELVILKALSRLGANLTVTVAADRMPQQDQEIELGPDAFLPGRKTAWWIQQQMPVATKGLYSARQHPLGARLLDRSAKPISNQQYSQAPYRLIQAGDRAAEIAWVAGEIRRLIYQEGYRCKDIVLAVCNLPAYASQLKTTFRRYDLPLFIDSERRLSGTPLMRLVLSLLDLGLYGYTRGSLLRVLRSGLLVAKQTDIDRLENHWLAWGLFREDRLFDPRYDDPQRGVDPDLPQLRKTLVEPIRKLLRVLKKQGSVADKCRSLQDYLLEQDLPAAIERRSEKLLAQGELEDAVYLTQSWNELEHVLTQMVQLAAHETIDLQSFRDSLAAGIDATQKSIIPTAMDQVSVGNLRRGILRQPKALFILGADAGNFPPAWPPEGLLKDQDRLSLSEALSRELPSHVSDQVFSDQFMLYTLITLPQERLYLTCSSPEESSWFDWLAQLHPPAYTRLREMPDFTDSRLFAPRPAFSYWLRQMQYPSAAKSEALASLQTCLRSRQDLPWSHIGQWQDADPRGQNVALPADLVQNLYGRQVVFSVSQLQNYASCPFQHWGLSLLRLKERPVWQPQAAEMGTVLHRMAEIALRHLATSLSAAGTNEKRRHEILTDWLALDLEGRAQAWLLAATESSDLSRFREPGLQASLGRRAVRLMAASLQGMLRQFLHESFLPAQFEWRFGPGTNSSYALKLAEGQSVELAGIVDRIDQDVGDDGSRFRIIDYKSGSKDIDYDSLYHGLDLQLPLYLAAYRQNQPESEAIDAAYFQFDRPILRLEHGGNLNAKDIETELGKAYRLKGLKLDDAKLASLCRHSERKAVALIETLLEGAFAARPVKLKNGKAPCEWCPLPSLCRFDTHGGDFRRLPALQKELGATDLNSKDAFLAYLDASRKEDA